MPIPKLHKKDKLLHKVSLRRSTKNNINLYFFQDRYYCKNAHIKKYSYYCISIKTRRDYMEPKYEEFVYNDMLPHFIALTKITEKALLSIFDHDGITL